MKETIISQRLLSEGAMHRSSGMNWKQILGVATLAVVVPLFASAETGGTPEQQGKVFAGYDVHQSTEVGERFTSGLGGNGSMYNTLVNLQSGPRLLDQSLSMRSRVESGMIFDSLTESAAGFGGDPNQVGRFRMAKNKWYDLAVQYRHDQYYSDYNLLGNSLAVPNPNPFNVNVFNQSPHFMNTRRSMGDVNLKVLPQSWMSFRLGYSRGKDEGPASTSVHSPGNLLYQENISTNSSRYRFGMDVKPLARTQFSYDFVYEYDRNDTAGLSDSNALYQLGATGIFVDPDLTYDPNLKLPNCTFSAGNVVNSTCSGFIAYGRTQPVKTDLSTHQFAFVSNFIRKVDLSGAISYTGGSSKTAAYNETWSRFLNPTYSQNAIQGNSSNTQITGNADFKATIHLSKSWSFDEKFRWVHWRTPGLAAYTTLATNLTGATVLIPATLSPVSNSLDNNYLGENSKYNTMQLNWRPSSKVGGYVGYKIGVREITSRSQNKVLTLATNKTLVGAPASSVDNETEHHALLGFNTRPIAAWQIRVSGDLMSSDGAYTSISPRHAQTIKADTEYEIAKWGTIAGMVSFDERRNDGDALFPAAFKAQGEQYTAHNRVYGLSLDLHPTQKIDVDFGWSHELIYERSPQCIPLYPLGQTYGFGTNLCQYAPTSAGLVANRTNVFPMFSNYQENTHTGYVMMVLKPVRRITVNLGYDITSNSGYQHYLRADNGDTFQMPIDASGNAVVNAKQLAVGTFAGLYPWQPQGSLAFNWQRPVAGVSIEMAKGMTFKGGYNNYDYYEKGQQVAPVLARNFHGNTVTLSMKHSF